MVKKSNNYFYALGRRKSSVATVKLFPSTGSSLVNGIDFEKYFHSPVATISCQKPFVLTDSLKKYHFEAKIVGGGTSGQVEALVLALARALKKSNPDTVPALKAAKLFTVDSRVKQRRMVGTGGKARRQKQSPKR